MNTKHQIIILKTKKPIYIINVEKEVSKAHVSNTMLSKVQSELSSELFFA